MITAPPKGDVAGIVIATLTHPYDTRRGIKRYCQFAKMQRRAAALCIQKSGNTDRSESRESKKIGSRRSKRVKREKVTI